MSEKLEIDNVEEVNKEYDKAPFIKRGFAFIIDAVMAFLPALVVYFIFTGTFTGYTPLYYPAPVIGAVSMIELPAVVNEKVSTVETDKGGVVTNNNYSMVATGSRMLSVFVIIFYIGYGTFCTLVYDGKTIGKKLMKLRVVSDGNENVTKAYIMREVLGKVIINSTVVVPVISIIMVLFMPRGKAVHDIIGKTRVISE